jgi:TolB protein
MNLETLGHLIRDGVSQWCNRLPKVSVVGFCVVGEQDKEKKMIPSNFHPKVRLLAIIGGLTLAACVLALMATHKPTEAAFPGSNGKIAFASQKTGNTGEIYTITSDGKVLKRLTKNSYDEAFPAFSPNGRRIAFTSNRPKLRDYDIFTMNTGGRGVMNLTHDSGFNEREPAWSPDGTKIAFSRLNNIFVRNADGTNEIQLTEEGTGENGQPSWSPDGSKILFTRRCDISLPECFGIDLWVMNADGTDERRFSTDPLIQACRGTAADWSPDGTKIVFVCEPAEGNGGIYVVNADGSGLTRLTTSIARIGDTWPVWSPNGRKIAFVRHTDGPNDLYVMRADGTNITNYTNTPGANENTPSWQPRLSPTR